MGQRKSSLPRKLSNESITQLKNSNPNLHSEDNNKTKNLEKKSARDPNILNQNTNTETPNIETDKKSLKQQTILFTKSITKTANNILLGSSNNEMKSGKQKTDTKRVLKFDSKQPKTTKIAAGNEQGTKQVEKEKGNKTTEVAQKAKDSEKESTGTGASAISDTSSESGSIEMETNVAMQKDQENTENSQEEQETITDTTSTEKVIDWNEEGLQLLGRVTNKRAASKTPEEAANKMEQRFAEDSTSEETDQTVRKKSTWQQQITQEMEKKIDKKLQEMDEKLEKLKQMIYEHRNDFRVTLEQNNELASTYDKMSELCTNGITEIRKEVREIKSNVGKLEEKTKKNTQNITENNKKIEAVDKQFKNNTEMITKVQEEIKNKLEETKKRIHKLEQEAEQNKTTGKNHNNSEKNTQDLETKWETEQNQKGLYISGIQTFREWFGMDKYVHPNIVIQALLKETDMWNFFSHSYLADGKGKPRSEVNSMVVMFTSIQHKREATNRLIYYIKSNNLRKTGIRDCFNKQDKEIIKKIQRNGNQIKRKMENPKHQWQTSATNSRQMTKI